VRGEDGGDGGVAGNGAARSLREQGQLAERAVGATGEGEQIRAALPAGQQR